ncbi:MAG: DUF3179 domain-containing (seleno)protein, partial [Thermoanaerobaculia bacterium]
MGREPSLPLALLALLAGVATTSDLASAADRPPPGVEQLLPRGRIAAVMDPQFVPAAEADLPDHAWILGVAIGGQAKAYSLNLLNRHEVVNDRSGETA